MIPSSQAVSLSNKTILVTRPVGREQHLCHLIEQAGGSVIHYPVIHIQPLAESEIVQLRQLQEKLHEYSMAIFISRTAVEQGLHYFPALPEHLTIVSIGSKTSESLQQNKIDIDIEAPEHNTESLLQTAEFQQPDITGQQVLIFRGEGGRALLGDTLRHRGAKIRYVETYKRALPSLLPLTKKQIESLDAITVSSNEGLENLITLMQGAEQVYNIPLVLPSRRTAMLAGQYGFKTIITAQNATDDATLSALNQYFSSLK